MVGYSNDDINFPHELLLTNWQVSRLYETFEITSSADIKLLKTQLQWKGFLGRFLGPLQKTGSLLMKNVLKPLAKSVLIPLILTVVATEQIFKRNSLDQVCFLRT